MGGPRPVSRQPPSRGLALGFAAAGPVWNVLGPSGFLANALVYVAALGLFRWVVPDAVRSLQRLPEPSPAGAATAACCGGHACGCWRRPGSRSMPAWACTPRRRCSSWCARPTRASRPGARGRLRPAAGDGWPSCSGGAVFFVGLRLLGRPLRDAATDHHHLLRHRRRRHLRGLGAAAQPQRRRRPCSMRLAVGGRARGRPVPHRRCDAGRTGPAGRHLRVVPGRSRRHHGPVQRVPGGGSDHRCAHRCGRRRDCGPSTASSWPRWCCRRWRCCRWRDCVASSSSSRPRPRADPTRKRRPSTYRSRAPTAARPTTTTDRHQGRGAWGRTTRRRLRAAPRGRGSGSDCPC